MLDLSFMAGDEQKEVEASKRYFRDEVKKSNEASSSFSLSWIPQPREVSTMSEGHLTGYRQPGWQGASHIRGPLGQIILQASV